ncbi:putative peptidase domain-containing protein [Phyllosticta capitalensis]
MMVKSTATALLLLCGAIASPILPPASTEVDSAPKPDDSASIYDWAEGWTKDYTIHPSCNSTLRRQLREGLDEAVALAEHARDHLLKFGAESDFVQKYFGNGSTAPPVGWYDRIVNADKTGVVFRCDDPDRNCATQDQWAGHWRGANATLETVICPLSFAIRRPLSSVCNLGYTVAGSKVETFWATDLMHRLLHVPRVSEGVVEHYAEDYAGVLELAQEDPAKSPVNSDTLQYFAIDVYAYDVAAPGVGCTGGEVEGEEHYLETSTDNATAANGGAKECHTHDDGDVHCD